MYDLNDNSIDLFLGQIYSMLDKQINTVVTEFIHDLYIYIALMASYYRPLYLAIQTVGHKISTKTPRVYGDTSNTVKDKKILFPATLYKENEDEC